MRKTLCTLVAVLSLVFNVSAPALAQTAAPNTPGDVERRVEAILARMTLEEKIDLLGGTDGFFVSMLRRVG